MGKAARLETMKRPKFLMINAAHAELADAGGRVGNLGKT